MSEFDEDGNSPECDDNMPCEIIFIIIRPILCEMVYMEHEVFGRSEIHVHMFSGHEFVVLEDFLFSKMR